MNLIFFTSIRILNHLLLRAYRIIYNLLILFLIIWISYGLIIYLLDWFLITFLDYMGPIIDDCLIIWLLNIIWFIVILKMISYIMEHILLHLMMIYFSNFIITNYYFKLQRFLSSRQSLIMVVFFDNRMWILIRFLKFIYIITFMLLFKRLLMNQRELRFLQTL